MLKNQDLSHSDLARLTSALSEKERYGLGISTVLDGLVWPGMVGRTDHARLLAGLCRLRHLCVRDELALTHRFTPTTDSPERLHVVAEQARFRVMNASPRLMAFLVNVVREALVRWAPVVGPDAECPVQTGVRGSDLDFILENLGYYLGEHYRALALKQLKEAGEARVSTAWRWTATSGLWPLSDPKQALAHHRFCLLAMLDRVVAQRLVGMPNLLWVMGFNQTSAGRVCMGRRLVDGARAWLDAKSMTLEQARRGGEAQLVWLQVGWMVAKRPIPRYPLPGFLRDELELTVMPATLARLGLDDAGEQLLKRALVDREKRWIKQERTRRVERKRQGGEAGPFPKGMTLKGETRKRWRGYASFESEELQKVFKRGMLPVAVAQVRTLLQESLPDPLSLRQIYDHALVHWPVELHSLKLLERACDMLVASHQAAENRVLGPERVPKTPNWLKGYKSITMEFNCPDLSPSYCKNLTEHLSEVLQCLSESETEDPPFIETAYYLFPRAELAAFRAFMLQLREEELDGVYEQSNSLEQPDTSSIAVMVSTLRSLPVHV